MEQRLADDLVVGAKEIAEYLGKTERQTRHWIAIGSIPTFKIGGKVAAYKSRIAAHLTKLEAGKVA